MGFAEKILKDMEDCRCGHCCECTIIRLRGLLRETEPHFADGSTAEGMALWSRILDELKLETPYEKLNREWLEELDETSQG